VATTRRTAVVPAHVIAYGFVIAAGLVNACGGSSSPPQPTPQPSTDLTGTWQGAVRSSVSGATATISVSLNQSGSSVSGSFSCPFACIHATGTVSGTVSGTALTARVNFPDGHSCGTFNGSVSGQTISGNYSCIDPLGNDSGTWSVTRGTATTPSISIIAGVHSNSSGQVDGIAFAVNPFVSAATINSLDVAGPPGWNAGNTVSCGLFQPPGISSARAVCYNFIPAVTGTYSARTVVGGETHQASVVIDAANRLVAPQITSVDNVTRSQVVVRWTAAATSRSFLVRINPVPFTTTTNERVVQTNVREWTFSGLSLTPGAEYQAVVWAMSSDVITPEQLVGPFNMAAHTRSFRAP
jgi:hypothetical protein